MAKHISMLQKLSQISIIVMCIFSSSVITYATSKNLLKVFKPTVSCEVALKIVEKVQPSIKNLNKQNNFKESDELKQLVNLILDECDPK